jgi:hypothetical protein
MIVELTVMFFGEALHSFGDVREFREDVLFFIGSASMSKRGSEISA